MYCELCILGRIILEPQVMSFIERLAQCPYLVESTIRSPSVYDTTCA